MKIIQSVKILLFVVVPVVAAYAGEAALIEKRKTLVKVYDVQARDQLSVDNQYGQVKINLWDRKEIRVDIVIKANAPTDQRAVDYLNSISIDEKREGNIIMLRTRINREHFGNNNWNSWRSKPGEKNFIQIDYVISMPKGNALIVKNQFGNTTIPSFQAPLTVLTRYGDFFADDLENAKNSIEVVYGNAKIGKMDAGKLEFKYSTLNLAQVRNLNIINKLGKLHIGEVGTLEADIDYSGATIGRISESCNVKLNFSDNFNVDQLPQTAERVHIQASYSSVILPAESSQFDVTVSNGNFRLPANVKVLYTNQPNKAEAQHTTRQYSGKVGNGTGSLIKVVSRFGDVRLKE
ncbi:DUF4097 family beta strand repeat-containing protein [Arundinibacter roseus]|uniref:DUF4097 family beta strand repeat-containing protein n=1 Tax=Arundinibacter roseus TaxID=2070510 RepID=UPI0014051649|nr:DUF4097 family beta strand repeat-containing protein [Arundinibacter roseus]